MKRKAVKIELQSETREEIKKVKFTPYKSGGGVKRETIIRTTKTRYCAVLECGHTLGVVWAINKDQKTFECHECDRIKSGVSQGGGS